MAYKEVFVQNELFLEHNGIRIFHTYKHDDRESGPRQCWYGTAADTQDEGDVTNFDVRDLKAYTGDDSPEAHQQVIKTAIDNDELLEFILHSNGRPGGADDKDFVVEDYEAPPVKNGIIKALELSTAHIEKETSEVLANMKMGRNYDVPFRVANHQYGHILILNSLEYHQEAAEKGNYYRFPELEAVVLYALTNDCRIIYFDQDADTVQELETFDW